MQVTVVNLKIKFSNLFFLSANTSWINQPHEAEAVRAAGSADMCGMTRALISDPDMPGKAQEGRFDDIRACIACNRACIGHFHRGYPISCIQRPETGRELTYGVRVPAAKPWKIMVVGGGPAGMKAAAVAAARGHQVTLTLSAQETEDRRHAPATSADIGGSFAVRSPCNKAQVGLLNCRQGATLLSSKKKSELQQPHP